MKNVLGSLLTLFCFYVSYAQSAQIIPQPVYTSALSAESFTITPATVISVAPGLKNEATLFNAYLDKTYGLRLVISENPNDPAATIRAGYQKAGTIGAETYWLDVSAGQVSIRGGGEAGVFYGFLSLLQLMEHQPNGDIKIPAVNINDLPRFAWRGMHLDVCRHFFPKDFIKKYIDFLALYKMNTFHWHLTEDQGWRIEIKKYPLLTSMGGWRKGTMVGRYADHVIDTIPYGGFYTQEDIKEVVAYATERHITVVPEIEMPGHALAALTAYPQLGCTGGPYEVAREWGVFEDVFCAGNDQVFVFLEEVLTEICSLFPGKYIHIGGDECPKDRWKTCPKCQKRMKDEGLKDEHELQSYFINRIEKFLNSKGKQIIGWDEILEGGLAPNAAVMSWRGEEGGIAAAGQRHNVVMSPGDFCYFDHYQGNPSLEPVAFGGYTPLEKVYGYDPVPKGIAPGFENYIMGAQANIWTEYILSEQHVEYMALPRMAALAEVLWTPKENRNYPDFSRRLVQHLPLLDAWKTNYAKSMYQVPIHSFFALYKLGVEFDVNPSLDSALVVVSEPQTGNPSIDKKTIRQYSLPPGPSLIAGSPFYLIPEQTTLLSAYYKSHPDIITQQKIWISKSMAKLVYFNSPPSPYYNIKSDFTLVDGIKAELPKQNQQWLAWQGEDVSIIIDLVLPEMISQVEIGYLNDISNWIWLPSGIEIQVSKNGNKYTTVQTMDASAIQQNPRQLIVSFKKQKARYVKIVAKNPGNIPAGNPGAGKKSWLFFDEILID